MSAEDTPGEQRRVYPPHEVQARLEVSASGLRRLAGIYERTVRPLPRDDRGRVWPEDAIGELERARALVRQQRAVSIEAALLGQTLEPGDAPRRAPEPRSPGVTDVGAGTGAAILEELRALRELVEEQNRRIAELEEAVRIGRELPAAEPEKAPGRPEASLEAPTPGEPPAGREMDSERPEGARQEDAGDEGPVRAGVEGEARVEDSPWQRLRAWFGF